jgi:hypothetical protein
MHPIRCSSGDPGLRWAGIMRTRTISYISPRLGLRLACCWRSPQALVRWPVLSAHMRLLTRPSNMVGRWRPRRTGRRLRAVRSWCSGSRGKAAAGGLVHAGELGGGAGAGRSPGGLGRVSEPGASDGLVQFPAPGRALKRQSAAHLWSAGERRSFLLYSASHS